MKHFAVLLILLGLSALTPSRSDAADAYVIGAVHLRAGPDIGYPLIMTLPAGIPVSVYGCTTGWEWCDVQAEDNRGWISGQFLQYDYQNQRVLLPDYGARVGIPIVAFVLGTYWDQYYRARPWYRDRVSWSQRRFAHRPPPRPTVRPPRPGHRPTPARPRPPVNRPRPAGAAVARPPNNRPHTGNAVTRPRPQVSRPPSNQRPAAPANRPSGGNISRPSGPAKGGARPAQRPAQRAKPAPRNARDSKDGGAPTK